ncbi:MAG: NAD(P)/FAD-dependent oxidoreductase [Ignavibacteriaceae bacterium]
MNQAVVIIGGGAAGYFAAINFAEKYPGNNILILEKTNKILSKVKISGGGRCNVTNIISQPDELTKFYPRGAKELKGAFHRFTSTDTISWFENRGIKLKSEADGRIFPVTDDSQTIVNCLISSAGKAGIKVLTGINVKNISPDDSGKWLVETAEQNMSADKLLIAAGSNEYMWKLLGRMGHKIEPPVPSLFTFNIKDERIKGLEGISLKNAEVKIDNSLLKSTGDILITHWGVSGPVILKLSAWGARDLFHKNYKFDLIINWINKNPEQIRNYLSDYKQSNLNKSVQANPLFNLPVRLWERLAEYSGINPELKWNGVSKFIINAFTAELTSGKFLVSGKSTFKEEFVTCGGVNLKEVDFKTMQSKIHKGLFFAGEVLDIDAVTGGFNFQSAWTTAWIAANAMGKQNNEDTPYKTNI